MWGWDLGSESRKLGNELGWGNVTVWENRVTGRELECASDLETSGRGGYDVSRLATGCAESCVGPAAALLRNEPQGPQIPSRSMGV